MSEEQRRINGNKSRDTKKGFHSFTKEKRHELNSRLAFVNLGLQVTTKVPKDEDSTIETLESIGFVRGYAKRKDPLNCDNYRHIDYRIILERI
jgi:hypothetical protein